MTTSGRAGRPAGRHAAGADTAAGAELSPKAAAPGSQETAPLTGKIAAPRDDPDQLQREIERLREQLGETIRKLAARADVKSRAREEAAELTGRVRTMTVQVRHTAATRVGSMRSQVAGRTSATRQKAISVGGAGKDQVRSRAAAVGSPVWGATPDQVRRAVTTGASSARERWMPLAAAAGVLVAGCVAFRLWRRRQ